MAWLGSVVQRFPPRVLDGVGVGLLAAVLVAMHPAMAGSQSGDLQVYHLAVRRLLSDDVYLHGYPDWPFTYPPSALVLLGFAGLPWPVARGLMLALSVAACAVTIALTIRAAAPGSRWVRPGPVAVATALMLLSPAVVVGTWLGQAAPVVLGLSAVAAYGHRPTRDGIVIAVAVAIKLTPALFVVHWALTGRRRHVLTASAAFAVITVGTALVMPRSSWWYFGQGGLLRAAQDYDSASNQAISGTLARLGLDSAAGRGLAVVLALLTLPWALTVARRLHRAGRTAVAIPLVGVWSGLAAPLAWIHAFGWWIPLAVGAGLMAVGRRDRAAALLALLGPLVMYLGPWGAPGTDGAVTTLWCANNLIVGVVVTLLLAGPARGERTGPAAEPAGPEQRARAAVGRT